MRGVNDRVGVSDAFFRRSEIDFRSITECALDAIVLADSTGIVIWANGSARLLFGYTEDEILHRPIADLMPERFRSAHARGLERLHHTGEPHLLGKTLELEGRRKDGTEFPIELNLGTWRKEGETLFAGFMRDVSERKKGENLLKENEERFRKVFEEGPLGMCLFTEDHRFFRVNETMCRMLQFSEEELLKLRFADVTYKEDRDIDVRLAEKLLAGQLPRYRIEQRYVKKSGQILWCALTRSAIRDASGKFSYGIAMVERIDHRKRAASEALQATADLQAVEARMKAIVDGMLVGLIVFDERGIIESVNPAAERMLRYPKDALTGKDATHVFAIELDQPPESFIERIVPRALGRMIEWNARRCDGEMFPIELSLSELRTNEGARFAASIRDVSERREIDRLKHEFVSMVSHELRTPLASIRGSLGLLSAGALGTLPEEAREVVAIAERNTNRLISLINDILDLERLEHGKLAMTLETVEVEGVLRRAVESVEALAAQEGIGIEVSSARGTVFADGERITQVLVNLLSNAVKFSPRGSMITVSTNVEPGSVEVRVTDRGRGIPPAFKEAIFERFRQVEASDARQKGGTGLGLTISKAVIEQHRGSIGVDSEEGRGSTFWFRVPSTPAANQEGSGP